MENYPPFSFLNEQNQLDGFDVDVAKAVAQRLGVKLTLETPSWDVIAAGRWSGRYDICVCSMTPSKARAEVFDFPVEYYQSPAVIVVNAKDNDIRASKDLSGKKSWRDQCVDLRSLLEQKPGDRGRRGQAFELSIR